VLGDMGEVGDAGPEFHAEVGRYREGKGIDALLALAASTESVDAFGAAAMQHSKTAGNPSTEGRKPFWSRVPLHEDGTRRRRADRRERRGPLMLLDLAQWLAKDVRLFNVFNYITLRAVLACLTALAISLVLGPYVIRRLAVMKIGQAVRDDGPKSHLTKAGTPTMGGALILLAIGITVLLWGDLSNRFVWVVPAGDRGFRCDRLGRRLPQGGCTGTRRACRRGQSSSGNRCSGWAPPPTSAGWRKPRPR
jgi:hypothetical protein